MILGHEDMPFTKNGITPIAIGIHAVPSRMTIAQLIECIGKAAVENGNIGNATTFDLSVSKYLNILVKYGPRKMEMKYYIMELMVTN